MNGEDKSGQPRSREDLQEALEAVEWTIVRQAAKTPPRLFVMLATIREVLKEVIASRGSSERKQIGWYNPGSKRFCYMDVKEHAQLDSYASYTIPVYVLAPE